MCETAPSGVPQHLQAFAEQCQRRATPAFEALAHSGADGHLDAIRVSCHSGQGLEFGACPRRRHDADSIAARVKALPKGYFEDCDRPIGSRT